VEFSALTGSCKHHENPYEEFMALRRDSDLQYVKGVGPKLGAIFHKHGMFTVQDLLEFYPRTFEDRRAARNIASLKENETVSLLATIHQAYSVPLGRSQKKMHDIVLKDSSGMIHCKYFRTPYRGYFERFQPGTAVRVIGKVTLYRGRLEFHHPELREKIEEESESRDEMLPIYTEIEGVSSAKISKIIRTAFEQLEEDKKKLDPSKNISEDFLPGSIQEKYQLIRTEEALRGLHFPDHKDAEALLAGKSASHRRLIFNEFFWLEIFLAARKAGFQREEALAMPENFSFSQKLIKTLPFELTEAQKKVLREVQADLSRPSPMNRLVQGDVGSGKTIVGFLAAGDVVAAGYQVCLMAPTEILAEQHYKNALRYLEPLGMKVGFLAGKTKASERKELLSQLAEGKIQFLIGTHALIEEDVEFQNLAFVIIDEQHRFGVEQRAKLKRKGLSPHFLLMTATPIPRTLAMTVYGDLEVSTLRELPKGRQPIQTRVIFESKRPQALQFLQDQILKGRQAYVIYPLVEESEKIDLKNAVEEFEKLKVQFPQFRFDLLHGKMKPLEKDQVMAKFRSGETQVLVSTTVVEVGVDVPNANIILIEHAERFGLSQLHQLRGRVGRGEHKSFCILLMGYAVSEESMERTRIMERTTDGFEIAEHDLELRGPGQFLGTRQSGLTGFKLAHLIRDQEILQISREAAFSILREDSDLTQEKHKQIREELLRTHGPTALAGVG
jgi:ATP-dependent DNA helicase RecG